MFMRVRPSRRRRWNNILILSVIAFIAVLNLPTILQNYFSSGETEIPHLLNPNNEVNAMYFQAWSLEFNQGHWVATKALDVTPDEMIKRWRGLEGTVVDDDTFRALQPNLNIPQTIEVWYRDQEEPQRITYYKTPQFWLFKNWQDRWIAVSVDSAYLNL